MDANTDNVAYCKECGVLINKDILDFTQPYDHDEQVLIEEAARWSNKKMKWVGFITCPVCGAEILDE